jgi:hypothetical protein
VNARGLKAACLAVGLVTAWGGQANAGPSQSTNQIQLTITPSNNLTHVFFIYGGNGTTLQVLSVTPLPDLVGGTSTTDTISVGTVPFRPAGYTIIGLYDETNKLLSIGMSPTEANRIAGTTSFSNEFMVFGTSPPVLYSESDIASLLLSNDTAGLTSFIGRAFNGFMEIPVGGSGELVNFSNAANGGSMTADFVVPEPSPFFLASIGALALLTAHRRRKSPHQPGRKSIRDP